MQRSSRPVYSTETGRLCPECAQAVANCQCRQLKSAGSTGDGTVRISREVKGRRGKPVTVIDGLPAEPLQLAQLASKLKQHCSSGGSVESGGRILLQGDQRQLAAAFLEARGYRVKLAGS